ncbi:MAG: hypothetical protein K1X57_08875, partial [Gemmataceae bacterium]|nr:hypothetical protein [Gemmataceae bacterium]
GNHLEKADGPLGWKSCNLRSSFSKLINRAGLTAWPRLFHNLRSSCETELLQKLPVYVVAKWMGHDLKVSIKHYAQTTDEHFDRARGGAKSGALEAQKAAQQAAVGSSSVSQILSQDTCGEAFTASPCDSMQYSAQTYIGEGGIRTRGTV